MKPSGRREDFPNTIAKKRKTKSVESFAEQLHQLFTLIYQIVSIDSKTRVTKPVEFGRNENEQGHTEFIWLVSCKSEYLMRNSNRMQMWFLPCIKMKFSTFAPIG